MTDVSHEQRWGVYLVQAQNFAKRENYLEAVSRAGLVVDEVTEALSRATDSKTRERLGGLLLSARRQRDAHRAKFEVANAAIAARRAKVIESAAADAKLPLPDLPVPARRA